MKKSYLFFYSILMFFIFSSCITTKDIHMFQDKDKDLSGIVSPPPPPELRIKPSDNLYISIKTLDPEVNRIFNPSNVGEGFSTGTSSYYGDPVGQYINGYRVDIDSTVTLPVLGKINFVGLNLLEAQEHLKVRAEEFLKEPSVQIKFLNFKINMMGEVRTPGVYYNYEGYLNILEAIGRANGITDFANIKNVVVKRQNENRFDTHILNLTDNSVYLSEVFYLQPNDLVYIPPGNLKRRSYNSDTYGRFLGTISILLLTASFFLNN